MNKKAKYTMKMDWDKKTAEAFMDEPRIRKMLSMVGTGKTVLDVGCFTGDISEAIKNKGNQVIGLDCNLTFVAMTKKRGIPAKYTDFEGKFPIANNSVDQIFAGEIIEHIYNTENFLKECNRVLKKGGDIIISTPNINYWVYRVKMLFGKTLPYGIEAGEDTTPFPGHIRYYTVESLTNTVNKFGFKTERVIASNIINRAIKLEGLADYWPSIGYCLILKARKE